MKNFLTLLLLVVTTAVVAQRPYKIWTDEMILQSFNGTSDFTITGGDLKMTKFINGNGQVVLILNKSNGIVDTLSLDSLGGSGTTYVAGTGIVISNDTISATGPAGLGAAEEIIYDTLTARITANALTPGASYILTDFQSYHKPPNQFAAFGYLDTTYAPGLEPLVLTATSDSTIAGRVYSLNYPGDVLHYEPFPLRQAERGMTKGMITYRRSPEGIETSYDWRTVRVRRFDNDGNSYYVAGQPENVGLPFEDVLTIQNTDNVANVFIAPLADTIREDTYATYQGSIGAIFDLWANNIVLKFAPGKSWQQGNVSFNSSAYNCHIDVARHSEALSSFADVRFDNGTSNFIFYHDTTTRINSTWYPNMTNVRFYEGSQDVTIKNAFIEDLSAMGNFQNVVADNWYISHHVQFSNIGTTGADSLFVDSVFMYVTKFDFISTSNNYLSNMGIGGSYLGSIKGVNLNGLDISGSNITFLDRTITSGKRSQIEFFNGSLTDCTLDSAYIGNTAGIFTNSVFENAEIGGSHFTVADSLFVYEAMVNFATFNGDVNNTIIDGRDTLTGAVLNSEFLAEVDGAHIGVTVNKSLFKMAFYADWFNQCGGNGVSNLNAAHIVDNQPPCALTAVYRPTHVQTHELPGGAVQYSWLENGDWKGYPRLFDRVEYDTSRIEDGNGWNKEYVDFNHYKVNTDTFTVYSQRAFIVGDDSVTIANSSTSPTATMKLKAGGILEHRSVNFYNRSSGGGWYYTGTGDFYVAGDNVVLTPAGVVGLYPDSLLVISGSHLPDSAAGYPVRIATTYANPTGIIQVPPRPHGGTLAIDARWQFVSIMGGVDTLTLDASHTHYAVSGVDGDTLYITPGQSWDYAEKVIKNIIGVGTIHIVPVSPSLIDNSSLPVSLSAYAYIRMKKTGVDWFVTGGQ